MSNKVKQISLREMVIEECANFYWKYVEDENPQTGKMEKWKMPFCYGIPLTYDVDGVPVIPVSTSPYEWCCIVDPGYEEGKPVYQVCPHFEKFLAPLVRNGFPEYADAIKEYYKRLYKGFSTEGENVPSPKIYRCECGRPRAKGHRYCDICKVIKHKESIAKGVKKWRSKRQIA